LMDHFGEHSFVLGYQGFPIEYVYENYYKKSFINLQLNPAAGYTSALEMAHMGRTSVSNYPAPFCCPYKNTEEIIRIIELERENIGKERLVTAQSAQKTCNISDEWLNTEYWK